MSLAERMREIKQKLHEIERKHGNRQTPTIGTQADHLLPTGWPEVDWVLGGGLAAAGLHECCGVADPDARDDDRRNPWTPPVCLAVHWARRVLDASNGPSWIVWVGRTCFPYPAVLARGQDQRLLTDSLFVDAPDRNTRLWAVDVSLRCSAVAAVVADGRGFNMAATRRVQLLAADRGRLAVLLRPAWERCELSAASTRWLVRFAAGAIRGSPIEAIPRWSVSLLRCKGADHEALNHEWIMEWDDDARTVRPSAGLADQPGDPRAQPPSEARLA